MYTPEEIAEAMEESAELYNRMTGKPIPYHEELVHLLKAINDVEDFVDQIVGRWKEEFLKPASAHDKNNPKGQDYEDYSKSLIVPTEVLRRRKFKELAYRIYLHAVEVTDKHCKDNNVDLHRGALYANLAITYLERKQHELGLSWLLAAAHEDVRFNRVPNVYGSHAMSNNGILGDWVKNLVEPAIPADVMGFVNAHLGTAYDIEQLMEMLRSLAGQGDLNLFAGIINFHDMEGRTDYVGQSVRFTCLRDLATLFEVLLKRIGNAHNDTAVKHKFNNSPMLAKMIYQMHYQHYPYNAGNKHLRTEGIFWNAIEKRVDLIDAIDAGFSFVKDLGNDIGAVRTYMDTTTLCAANVDTDAIAKRFLLAYRLRNETSHGFTPSNPGIVANTEEFRLWLLQAIFYLFFWARDSGHAPL